jgi:branched-chain amino acid transport system ATP-binding protein
MLAIGRALMSEPRMLLLDEPSLGLAPLLVAEIFALIAGLRDQGISILLAEQNARMSLAIADRGYVIENGRVVLSGTGRELLASASVAERYLGMGEAMHDDPGVRRREMAAKLRAAMAWSPRPSS